MAKRNSALLVVFLAASALSAQNFQQIQNFKELASETSGFFEGFSKKTIQNNFNYHSFRHDLGPSMLTRCLETPTPMEWETAALPAGFTGDKAGFLWVAAMDMSSTGASFKLSFNGKKIFNIPATREPDWILEGESGSRLEFQSVMSDRHGDAHGYMVLRVPEGWLKKGAGQVIRIEGDRSNNSTWIIVYEAKDALEFLRESSSYSGLYRLEASLKDKQYNFKIKGPEAMDGLEIRFETGGFSKELRLQNEGGFARAVLEVPENIAGDKISLYDFKGEILVWQINSNTPDNSIIMAEGVLKNSLLEKSENGFVVVGERSYMPGLVEGILALSQSDMARSQIMLMNSSHQDIAWMDSPEKCVVERDTMLLQPLFERAAVDPNYRFDIEDALMVKEFIQRHPDKKGLVGELFTDGRISCGATYIQPYEEMYSGEALARQFYFGKKWLKDEFGYTADTYWNVDVPGRTRQMPQLMKKAGVENLVMTRQELGFYNWYSPDGSKITGFSNGHYGDSFGPLGDEYYIAADYLSEYTFKWEKFFNESSGKPVVPLLSDWDMSPAKDYCELLSSWSSLKELKTKDGSVVPVTLPELREALAPDMFRAFRESNPVVPEIYGERPALWMYIHGPSHQKAIKASREADILLTQVEKLATLNSLLEGSFRNYPEKSLREAWESKIYPDHGWGGKMGHITDAMFEAKYEYALGEAKKIGVLQMKELGSRINFDEKKGRPILVFNSLSWERSSPVVYNMLFDPGDAWDLELSGLDGENIPLQLNDAEFYEDGSLRSATLNFIASGVPSVGYKVFYVKGLNKKEPVPMPKQGKRLENQFYIVEFGKGGLERIYDKELKKEIILPNGFKAGEVFTLRSIGNGAGEFDQIQQPDTVGFDKTGNYDTPWKIIEDGSVFASCGFRQPVRNAVIEQKIILYKDVKKIDFETAVLNWEGILYREYRMALPVNADNGKIVYEVPYGKLEVGKGEMEGAAGERYQVDCKDIHPRSVQNWINVSSDDIGVTLSSSVVGVDYVDITGTSTGTTLIQPILIASRRSCHGEGNEYLQTGDHYFSFSLQSHAPGWEKGYRFGLEANEKLLVTSDIKKYTDAGLPEEKSFFSLGSGNVVMSVIKKADDSKDVVIRAYEVEGKKSETGISSAFRFANIVPASLIEEEKGEGIKMNQGVLLRFGAYSIETFKLKMND